MGLSRKLGQASSQPSISPQSQIVAYQWSHQGYTIQDILRKFKLPCVVQCATTESCTVLWSDFHFDLRQPLLLYSLRTVKKIHARSLDKTTHEEIGPPVAIPEDYEGWFASTPKGVSTLKRQTRVQGIANTNAPSFLVCTKCPAFTSSKGLGSSVQYFPNEVAPGEILKRVAIMEGEATSPNVPTLVQSYGPCLECLDGKGEDVVIPLSHRVMTYEIADSFPCEEHKVFNTQSIIAAGNKHLPRMFTIVYGDPPTLSYSHTGLYRAYSVFTEETVLAATLDNPKSICLELATDSFAKFNIGLNDVIIKKTCEYNNAFQVCHKAGEKFTAGIKVSFSLKPEVSGLDDTDVSVCDNISSDDIQEVDANSEFEIAWGSGGKSNVNTKDHIKPRINNGNPNENELLQGSKPGNPESSSKIIGLSPFESSNENLSHLGEKAQTNVNEENAKLELLSSTFGEDVVKTNPLFVPQSETENEHVVDVDFDSEDISVISEDIVEISIEETDYSTMEVKKANEYNEASLSSDESDSENEDSFTLRGKTNEENCSTGVKHTTVSFNADLRDEDIVCVNNEEESRHNVLESELENTLQDGNVSVNFKENDYPDSSIITVDEKKTCAVLDDNGLETNSESVMCSSREPKEKESMTNTQSDEPVKSAHQDPGVVLTPNSNDALVVREAGGKEEGYISKGQEVLTGILGDKSQSATKMAVSPETERKQNVSDGKKSLKTKSSKKQKATESETKGNFSFSFIHRLRKFKSGSNVNVCSDLDIVSDNRFQSSKVRHHPHSHPHKDIKEKVLSVSHGTSLNKRERTHDLKASPRRLKRGFLRLDDKVISSLKSWDKSNKSKTSAGNTSNEKGSKKDKKQYEQTEAVASSKLDSNANKELVVQDERRDVETSDTQYISVEKISDTIVSSIDGFDGEEEEFA